MQKSFSTTRTYLPSHLQLRHRHCGEDVVYEGCFRGKVVTSSRSREGALTRLLRHALYLNV
jgi:hypothetical protein